jgi:glycosyltransferase involved in cell wall biosynthesis
MNMHPDRPLVSIVTPAHNEEQYVAECIESVLKQTYDNWEFVILDNCSADKTSEIAQQYAASDPRLRVVRCENLVPAAANFNRALRLISSRSKYCKMVLADDWIMPDCIERMVALMEENPTMGLVGAYTLQDHTILCQGLSYQKCGVYSGREICRQRLMGGPYIFGSQTSVMYRSDLVRKTDPFFNESNPHGNDSEACFELLKDSDFGFIFQVLTYSRERAGSLYSESRKINASAADILRELNRFGPTFLSPDEFSNSLTNVVKKYYEFLASNIFRFRGKHFWTFHKDRFRAEGIPFSYLELALGLLRKVNERFQVRPRDQLKWGL